jgi:hypothetical protein
VRKFLLVTLIFVIAGSAFYFLFTESGSEILVKKAFAYYLAPGQILIEKTRGSLFKGLLLEKVKIRNLEWWPSAVFRIQRLKITLLSLFSRNINIEVFNGTLQWPLSETILFYGNYRNGSLNINVYSNHINIAEIVGRLNGAEEVKGVSGVIKDLDVFARGPLSSLALIGSTEVANLKYKGFSLGRMPLSFKLNFSRIKNDLKINGEIDIKRGVLSGQKTAVVQLQPSKLFFTGNPDDFAFDIKGVSTVEGVNIYITLNGTMKQPELKLSSGLSYSQDYLLLMLVTGKRWKGAEMSLQKEAISPGLALDFIDYFLFSGSGDSLLQHLGIADVTVQYDTPTRGVGITKDITEQISLKYKILQHQASGSKYQTTEKIGAGYDITEDISTELELQNTEILNTPEQSQNSGVALQFQIKF